MELRIKNLAYLLILALTACATAPAGDSLARTSGASGSKARIGELQARVVDLEAELDATRERGARTELRRLDAEAQLADLRRRYDELSHSHDEAVAEVVRAQAKLRGSVSQADAASNIAEAEIALAGLADDGSMQARQARSVLRQASEAFSQENFGGALYLSNRAKRLMSKVGGEPMPLSPVADEIAFGAPLPLVVSGNSNLRAGPGLEYAVLATLAGGTEVDGYTYKDAWVRVRLADGSDGWVYQGLVAERDRVD